jgi:hypothetical protein
MMPTKTSVGPNEVVRLEVLRLTPPLLGGRADRRSAGGPNPKARATGPASLQCVVPVPLSCYLLLVISASLVSGEIARGKVGFVM